MKLHSDPLRKRPERGKESEERNNGENELSHSWTSMELSDSREIKSRILRNAVLSDLEMQMGTRRIARLTDEPDHLAGGYPGARLGQYLAHVSIDIAVPHDPAHLDVVAQHVIPSGSPDLPVGR